MDITAEPLRLFGPLLGVREWKSGHKTSHGHELGHTIIDIFLCINNAINNTKALNYNLDIYWYTWPKMPFMTQLPEKTGGHSQ